MRTLAWPLFILLALAACDKEDDKKRLVTSVVGDAASPFGSAEVSARASREGGAAPSTSVAMPERPVPKGQTMVTQAAPEEVQMKAITYMASMKAPHLDDASVDEAYATELVAKL